MYHRHPRELARGQGENADNSIYIERGREWSFWLRIIILHSVWLFSKYCVDVWKLFLLFLYNKKSYYIAGGGLLSMVELMDFPDCQSIYMHHQTTKLQLSSTFSAKQWIHTDYLLVLGAIKVVKTTMWDAICLITLLISKLFSLLSWK